MYMLMIGFGALHGLVFLPVLLSYVGECIIPLVLVLCLFLQVLSQCHMRIKSRTIPHRMALHQETQSIMNHLIPGWWVTHRLSGSHHSVGHHMPTVWSWGDPMRIQNYCRMILNFLNLFIYIVYTMLYRVRLINTFILNLLLVGTEWS